MADLFSRERIDDILSTMPDEARACYTGQSILAYCPDPTFDWAELNTWPDETDVDIFVYSRQGLAACTQAYIDAGWEPNSTIDEFKAERIRFWDPTKKFKLHTVALKKEDHPVLNLTWTEESTDVVATIKRFDMDYLMVGLDLRTRKFLDLRGPDHRIANVNHFNSKFDVEDVDTMFWLRQFDRVPKGYARGIDTRPVARQYLAWVEQTIAHGDKGIGSKSRMYAQRKMESVIAAVVEAGFSKEQAEAMYHLVRQEDHTWEAMRIQLDTIRGTITEWLSSVEDD